MSLALRAAQGRNRANISTSPNPWSATSSSLSPGGSLRPSHCGLSRWANCGGISGCAPAMR